LPFYRLQIVHEIYLQHFSGIRTEKSRLVCASISVVIPS
jgi:hypothetical protein